MAKRKKAQIELTEVLEELKTSVFVLYQWKKVKLSAKLRKQIVSIKANDILPYFSQSEYKEWQRLNAHYKISSYWDYLGWLDKNFTVPDRNGEFISQIKASKKAEKTQQKKLANSWTKLHSIFFTRLNPKTLKFINTQYEEKHLIDKSAGLLASDSISRETKEEVRFDFYALVQQVSNNSARGLGKSEPIPHLPSRTSPLFWINMIKELTTYRYLPEDHNEDLIKLWAASCLSFTRTNNPVFSINKLKWVGPATAFAEWIWEVQKRLIDPKYSANSNLLKWVYATIDYPGTKKALISALSSSTKYKSKYFTFSGEGNTASFAVNMFPRASKNKKR